MASASLLLIIFTAMSNDPFSNKAHSSFLEQSVISNALPVITHGLPSVSANMAADWPTR